MLTTPSDQDLRDRERAGTCGIPASDANRRVPQGLGSPRAASDTTLATEYTGSEHYCLSLAQRLCSRTGCRTRGSGGGGALRSLAGGRAPGAVSEVEVGRVAVSAPRGVIEASRHSRGVRGPFGGRGRRSCGISSPWSYSGGRRGARGGGRRPGTGGRRRVRPSRTTPACRAGRAARAAPPPGSR